MLGVGMLVHKLGAQRLWNGLVPLRTSGCFQATPAGIALKKAETTLFMLPSGSSSQHGPPQANMPYF